MTKYIISSGTSVVKCLNEQPDHIVVEITTQTTPIHFDTIGEAMRAAVIVNNVLHSNNFKVMSHEV